MLTAELARLRAELDHHRTAAEKARAVAEEKDQARLSAEERARREGEERAVWEHLAAEAEEAKAALATQLQMLQTAAAQASAQLTVEIAAKAEAAAAEIDIDEASTRALIDEQLRARGWEVDTQSIRYSAGSRPAKGRNLAIAEWPTKSGPADYALFVGTRCIGIVEAKRRNKNVSSHIDQAERYARSIRFEGGAEAISDRGRMSEMSASSSRFCFPRMVGLTSSNWKPRAGSGFVTLANRPITDARSPIGQLQTA